MIHLGRMSIQAVLARLPDLASDQMAAKDARKWGMGGHTFHPHIVYLRALLVRNRRLFFRICFVASCEMAVAGRTGPNAVGIMPKVHDMWVNSLAALLGALAAIRSPLAATQCAVIRVDAAKNKSSNV